MTDKAGDPSLTNFGGILSVPDELEEILLIIFNVSKGSVGARKKEEFWRFFKNSLGEICVRGRRSDMVLPMLVKYSLSVLAITLASLDGPLAVFMVLIVFLSFFFTTGYFVNQSPRSSGAFLTLNEFTIIEIFFSQE